MSILKKGSIKLRKNSFGKSTIVVSDDWVGCGAVIVHYTALVDEQVTLLRREGAFDYNAAQAFFGKSKTVVYYESSKLDKVIPDKQSIRVGENYPFDQSRIKIGLGKGSDAIAFFNWDSEDVTMVNAKYVEFLGNPSKIYRSVPEDRNSSLFLVGDEREPLAVFMPMSIKEFVSESNATFILNDVLNKCLGNEVLSRVDP